MRTRRLLAALGAPLLAVACATGSSPIVASGDGGGGGDSDASYGADDAGGDGGTSSGTDSGVRGIDSGVTDSGGGGGGALVTPGGDCIGDPQAPFGYDFACELAESLGGDSPCTPDAGMCGAGNCCFTDTSSMCYTDGYGFQCVPYM